MGRVNSRIRLGIAEWFGCDTADGTYLAYGPDKNLPKLLSWLDDLDGRPSLFGRTHAPGHPCATPRTPPPQGSRPQPDALPRRRTVMGAQGPAVSQQARLRTNPLR
ncbi:hypothetical protein ACIQVK_31150 [Streptomyces sp. NPDC090493]|uniref:hypothetical protein n=1 Tax=Streptomyces sp. NPDC090493 TaxID=3365964 RepID=UPI0038042BF3